MVLGVPNNSLTCMQGQKTLLWSYNIHLFLPYLLNHSLNDSFLQTPPLRDATICGDWSDLSHFHVIVPVTSCQCLWVQCCFVYSVTGENAIFTAPKAAPSCKERMNFHLDQQEKNNKWACNMLMFHGDVNMKRFRIRFKINWFQWFRVDSFFWDMNFIQDALSDLKHCWMFLFT